MVINRYNNNIDIINNNKNDIYYNIWLYFFISTLSIKISIKFVIIISIHVILLLIYKDNKTNAYYLKIYIENAGLS